MSVTSPTRLLRLLTMLIPATVLIGCGDGDGQAPIPGTPQPELTGVLVDSPVSGVQWKTSGGTSGLTTDLGEFNYTQPESGTFIETITFSIGDIVLGTAEGIPFKGERLYISAVELTGSIDPLALAATNQLVFIQSIDSDGDPTNGITISEATRTAAVGQTLDFNSSDFATEVEAVVAAIAPGNTVVSNTAALDHFYTTYAALGGTDTFDWLFPGYPPVGDGEGVFRLVFADEFDVDGPPNPDIWNIDLGYGPNGFGWGNNEWQLYTDSPDNLRVEDGNLVITALCPVEPCGVRDGTITSGRITTNDKFEFKYGKIVARIKPPVGQGTWPAFWSLGKDFPTVQWPRVGEIDFMEVFNNTYNSPAESEVAERTATSAMHWCDELIVPDPLANCFPAGRIFVADKLELEESLGNDFQIWEADWNADRVVVSINGRRYFELEIDPSTMEEFRREFFLLLNVAMGGTLGSGGEPPQGDETFPQTMLVDYVRVFQQVDDISPPELTTVNIASSNANAGFATTGDIVTVTLTADEPIATPIVTIGGIAATDVTGADTDWQASRALTADDADGVVEFTVEYTDVNGNPGVPVFTTTDASRVTADATAPVLTAVTIASNNTNPSLAAIGDVVTVTLTADESIEAPTVTIGGIAAVAVGSGANWQASRVITDADADGVIPFSITYADFAGNAGVPVSATTDSSNVIVSTNAPTVTIGGAPATFTTLAPIPVTFQFSKPVTGFDVSDIQVRNNSGAARDFVVVDEVGNFATTFNANVVPNGVGPLVIGIDAAAAADAAGNDSLAAADVTVTSALDPNAPLLNPISITSSNANPGFARAGDVVTLTFTANEPITQPTVTLAGASLTPMDMGGNTWQAVRLMAPGDPEESIEFAIDNFEDVQVPPTQGERSTVTTDGSAVIFDVTAPTLSIVGLPADVEFVEPIPTTFQFGEDVSGFDSNGIQVTNGIAAAFTVVDAATYTADIIPTGAGDLTVDVAADVATDAAGNGNVAASETAVVGSAWRLVWSDNFDVAGLNPTRWTARVTEVDCPDPCDGVQRYRTERVTVAGDGLLTIEARDEAGFSSGIVDTKGNLEFTYGRVEIDARMPGTQGTLPSLRLLPAVPGGESVANYGPWPQSGEIDIVNAPNLGPSNSTLEHTLIYGLPEPENTATTANSVAPGVPTLDIIQYAIEWEGGEIRWFVNDVHVATQTQDNWYAYFQEADADGIFGPFTLGTGAAPFDDDFYVVIGLAVGSNADSFFPQTLEIDAVRVYECANPVDPLLGSGCSTGTGVPPEIAPGEPFVVVPSIEVYTDAPATLDFVEPDGVTTISATWNQTDQPGDPSNSAVSNISSPDGATNTVWNADIQAVIGAAFVTIDVGGFNENNPAESLRYLDLSGGEAAGEVLFRMRVNSATSGVELFFDLGDRPLNFGRVPLDFVADGQWRDYSVKIADLLAASVAQGRAFDIADVFGLSVGATDGSVNLDLDDISIKVACRDVGGCEATPRSDGVPATVVYSEDFESLDASSGGALGPFGAGWQIFADVWDGPVETGTFQYQYGPFAAPNPGAGPGFSQVIDDINECFAGGGKQCLNVFSDYNNQDHAPTGACSPNSCTINTSVLKDLRDINNTITAADIGLCWTFTGEYKSPTIGGIGANTTANAYITTLDPNDNFAATNVDRFDTTAASNTDYARFTVHLDTADPLLIGQLLQIGFNTTATNFEPSGVYYDSVEVSTRPGACPADP